MSESEVTKVLEVLDRLFTKESERRKNVQG